MAFDALAFGRDSKYYSGLGGGGKFSISCSNATIKSKDFESDI